jgi:hypothetical protein
VEMLMLIAEHDGGVCDICTARTMNGGLNGWAKKLWEVVQKEVALDDDSSFDPKQLRQLKPEHCYNFMYALNVKNTILGKAIMEPKAIMELRSVFGDTHTIVGAPEQIDKDFAVDIIVDDKVGIQVKPESYKRVTEAHAENLKRNTEWGRPVHYLYYKTTTEVFVNLRDVATAVATSLGIPDPHRPKKRSFAELKASATHKRQALSSAVAQRTDSLLPTHSELVQ